ncbi:MAG: hypothetical protein HY778_15775 [Betaproteobacteria bacterium]|nr:hypothetical protein [Betaproteobacteria bacterium]
MTADDNLRLIREIEADRAFLLAVFQQNPELLARAEVRIRELFEPLPAAWPAEAQDRLAALRRGELAAVSTRDEVFGDLDRQP